MFMGHKAKISMFMELEAKIFKMYRELEAEVSNV